MISRLPTHTMLVALLAFLLASCSQQAEEEQELVVLAASSMQEAMEAVADEWEEQGHPRPSLSFSASPSVARQVAEGAPADIAITADAEWMDWMEDQGILKEGSRRDIAGNRLVVVKPRNGRDIALDALGDERLALADTEAVPAGRYARAALVSLGLWDELERKVVPAENVRAALALVERGEVSLGIVYISDALVSQKVAVVRYLPTGSYPEIHYPAAVIATSRNLDSDAFIAFLESGEVQEIFSEYGFEAPN